MGNNVEIKNEQTEPARLVDVAARACVSLTTAARVFNKKWDGKVRDITRERVLAAAAELGYSGTDALGSALRTGSTKIVALVVGDTVGYLYSQVLLKFVEKLRESGRQVMIFEVNPAKNVAEILNQIQQYRLDAMIITATATQFSYVENLSESRTPIIFFNRQSRNNDLCAVYCDGKIASAKVAHYLMDHGHHHMALITGNANIAKELEREDGFCQAVLARGGDILDIKAGDYTYDSGFHLCKQLLQKCTPDAIFCAEDSIAMGAMDAARELGFSVPEDISIMGFDHIEAGQYRSYRLATVAHPIDAMIQRTIDLLDALMKNPKIRREYIFDVQVIDGASVAHKHNDRNPIL